MSYRDMTFCRAYKDCADSCHRALTEEVLAGAKKWWGSDDAPIMSFVGRPDCHMEVTTNG